KATAAAANSTPRFAAKGVCSRGVAKLGRSLENSRGLGGVIGLAGSGLGRAIGFGIRGSGFSGTMIGSGGAGAGGATGRVRLAGVSITSANDVNSSSLLIGAFSSGVNLLDGSAISGAVEEVASGLSNAGAGAAAASASGRANFAGDGSGGATGGAGCIDGVSTDPASTSSSSSFLE